ncbi:MAG TPA: bifunctional precorrin-2 dehydrogenase/sirohydrochlorin ferrochelatase [Smithella sp.]|nr:bifunctional precorrin-2 dehydrogenase/sirohydrochlorin ferrochelatase [Smithella sp.]MDM7987358.1 bifunctional precorrin-2 dehydrogenase/sirohydrochlorin ferrochelatase [Smithella sp.]HNY49741.1 bifunctional precorrin-2 dehydrogenase/sirohydrochlorin ferrochelatase [Smithella sp.]HOG90825.1 bifunctional precorrin-2 dehydrogenase/sirohydrochlorin ferrochelatase [Smithella sp.]HOU51614.1 bifunctional precorrin-2 dehydrogenase/sirohydrochlorin ferrochelatase [Smithella sp.]
MRYYPVFLDIRDKICVIVGGGEVALRKAERLLDCGAKISVISPKLVPELAALKDKGLIYHIDAEYSGDLIDQAVLVIGATDDEKTNARISEDARGKGIPVNIVDDPQKCDFILPSIVQRGDLAITIGTGGKSPALARHLRKELEKQYGKEYEIFLNILGILRTRMEKNAGVGKDWFDALMVAGILDSIKARDIKKVKEIVKNITGEEVKVEF